MRSQYDKSLGLDQRTQASGKMMKRVEFETRRIGTLEDI